VIPSFSRLGRIHRSKDFRPNQTGQLKEGRSLAERGSDLIMTLSSFACLLVPGFDVHLPEDLAVAQLKSRRS
jgi:hypothetical protein